MAIRRSAEPASGLTMAAMMQARAFQRDRCRRVAHRGRRHGVQHHAQRQSLLDVDEIGVAVTSRSREAGSVRSLQDKKTV